jgi:hypothetical protein
LFADDDDAEDDEDEDKREDDEDGGGIVPVIFCFREAEAGVRVFVAAAGSRADAKIALSA